MTCEGIHTKKREAFLLGRGCGKPRQDPVYAMYKKAQANFKYALHYCKSQQAVTLSDKMAAEMTYLGHCKKHNQSKCCLSDTVDDAVGNQNIADMWGQHYKTLLNLSSVFTKRMSH